MAIDAENNIPTKDQDFKAGQEQPTVVEGRLTTLSEHGQGASEDSARQVHLIEQKIDDANKIDEIRARIGVDNRDAQIQAFVNELPSKEGHVDFSQLQKLGHGGTHDVYIYPQNPRFVIKINRGVLEKAISVGKPELPPDVRIIADEYAERENANNEELYKHFGRENCLCETVMVRKISIVQDGVGRNIEGVFSIQEASDVFKDPTKKDFTAAYTERDLTIEEKRDIYDKMNRALLGSEDFDENDFLKFNEKLRDIFDLADKDKEFSDRVREFLLRFKDYFESSGKFIDLVGQDNVLFYKKEGKWSFKLGSVVKGENKQIMEDAMGALEASPESINQDQKLKGQLLNQLALIRLVNAVGLKLGLGKIIAVELSEKQLRNLDTIKF